MFSTSKIESKNLLLLILFVKFCLLFLLIKSGYVGLSPDEAQYWTWSKSLDWGYFSKPPAISWQIFATTSLFGATELGVRFGALVIGFFISLAVYWIAKACGCTANISFWAALAMAFSPLGIYLSFAATTDGGAILFLALGIWAILWKNSPSYLLAGVFILIGALFKWTALILWPFVLLFACFYPEFRKKSLTFGILISLCAFLPVIYWNSGHDWATFRHVGKATVRIHQGNFFDFLLSQIGLLSPIFFILLILSFFFLFQTKNRKLFFCAIFPLAVLAYFALSLFKKIQPNWPAFLYPPGMVLVAWVAIEKNWKKWLYVGFGVALLMSLMVFSVPWIQKNSNWPLPYSANSFRHSVGWDKLPKILEEVGYNPKENFLFGDKYQTASILSFYSPGQKRAYFFNISDSRKNQFSYWPQVEEREVGKDGFFLVLENTNEAALDWYKGHYQKKLSPYFREVVYRGAYPLYSVGGEGVKYALIFKGIGYEGGSPLKPNRY